MMISLARIVWTGVSLAALAISLFVLANGGVRRALLLAVHERIGSALPPDYVVAGDSLAAQCEWGRELGRRPFAALNLAAGGATIKEIAGQIMRARPIRANYLLINGGLNDLLFDNTPVEQIEYDLKALLRRIDDGQKAVVTLMPYVADPAYTARIDAANSVLRRLAEERGFAVVDLNPEISSQGTRRPEMTSDGLHFTPLADAIWIAAVKAAIARQIG